MFGAHTKRQKFKKGDYILAISESGMLLHEILNTVLKFEVDTKQFSGFFIIDGIIGQILKFCFSFDFAIKVIQSFVVIKLVIDNFAIL